MRFIIFSIFSILLNNFGYCQNAMTLQKALQTTRLNNPILKTEYFNINISKSDIITAKLRPNLTLNNQSLQLVAPSEITPNTSWYNNQNRQVWWQLTKTIQLPSQRKAKINFAEKNVLAIEKKYEELERNVFNSVAESWLNVWYITKQLEVIKKAKNNIDSLVYINKQKLKNQAITPLDVARTELLSNQYTIQIKSTEQDLINEKNNLRFLIGINEDFTIDLNDNFEIISTNSLDSLLQFAQQERVDIQGIKNNIIVAESNIKLQESFKLPQPELGVIWNPQNSVPYMGFFATVELPIFSRNQGEIQKSNLIKQQNEQNLQATQLNLKTDLTNAFNSYLTQKQILASNNDQMKQSIYILNGVKYTYLRGGTTIIDYFEAERSWISTQQLYYDALQKYRLSYIKLLYTSGIINQIAQ